MPLWYGEDVIKQELTSSSAQHPRACSRCGGHRAFELQLMPTLLSLLPIEEHARKCAIESDPATSQPDAQSTSTNQQQQVMPWGMEWGTLLVYSCAKDCPPKSGPASAIDMLTPAQLDDLIAACRRRDPAVVSYAEEEVYVQLD